MFAGSAILLEVLTIIRVGQELHLERLRGMTKEQAARYWERVEPWEDFWFDVAKKLIQREEQDEPPAVIQPGVIPKPLAVTKP